MLELRAIRPIHLYVMSVKCRLGPARLCRRFVPYFWFIYTDNWKVSSQHSDSPRHAIDYYSDAYLDGLAESEIDGLSYSDDDDNDELYCKGCARQFVDTTALNNHLASSSKHNGLTATVRTVKIVPNISTKRITGPVQPPTTLRSFFATEASFNGSSYQCYLCTKKFKTLPGLNSHLNSPVHDNHEFRCPKCKTTFKLISGFVQHMESRSCGLAETTKINNYFNDLTDQFSRRLKITEPAQPPRTFPTFIVAESFFSPCSFQCYLCTKQFKTFSHLKSHLDSSAHIGHREGVLKTHDYWSIHWPLVSIESFAEALSELASLGWRFRPCLFSKSGRVNHYVYNL